MAFIKVPKFDGFTIVVSEDIKAKTLKRVEAQAETAFAHAGYLHGIKWQVVLGDLHVNEIEVEVGGVSRSNSKAHVFLARELGNVIAQYEDVTMVYHDEGLPERYMGDTE